MNMITIENDGAKIRRTNYPDTDWYKGGIIAASVNAGCLRLLMPDAFLPAVTWDMQTAKEVVITKGIYQGRPGYEVMFDDYSDNPYMLQLDTRQFVSAGIADSENGKELLVAIYGMYDGKFQQLHITLGKFRVGKFLPCLKPWGEPV